MSEDTASRPIVAIRWLSLKQIADMADALPPLEATAKLSKKTRKRITQ